MQEEIHVGYDINSSSVGFIAVIPQLNYTQYIQ